MFFAREMILLCGFRLGVHVAGRAKKILLFHNALMPLTLQMFNHLLSRGGFHVAFLAHVFLQLAVESARSVICNC